MTGALPPGSSFLCVSVSVDTAVQLAGARVALSFDHSCLRWSILHAGPTLARHPITQPTVTLAPKPAPASISAPTPDLDLAVPVVEEVRIQHVVPRTQERQTLCCCSRDAALVQWHPVAVAIAGHLSSRTRPCKRRHQRSVVAWHPVKSSRQAAG